MPGLPFVDCQGLAGAWTLGTVQAGFELTHRASMEGGFGDETIDANRRLVGDGWAQDPGGSVAEWEPRRGVGLVCGTPPCSGFSMMNTRAERGPDNPINHCMGELVEYGALCSGLDGARGAEVVAFESVQGAYKKGRALMQALRDRADRAAGGERYDLHHVVMSGASVGAAQYRPRYYMVLSRVPFGIDPPRAEDTPDGRAVTYWDALADLQGLESETWAEQPRAYSPASGFARRLAREDGQVDAHFRRGGELGRIIEEVCNRGMQPRWYLSQAFDWLDYHPEAYARSRGVRKVAREGSTYRGFSWPRRVPHDGIAWVVTGGSTREFIHWAEPRLLTVRELSRLMGYPDDWRWPSTSVGRVGSEIGKCCPCDSGRWVSTWVRRALESTPGQTGEKIGDREYLYNFTRDFKEWK